MRAILSFLFWALVLFIWFAYPKGGAYEDIKAANPAYQHPNKYFQEMVTILTEDDDAYWKLTYLSDCDVYGDNYEDFHGCYYAHAVCEYKLPLKVETWGQYPDLFPNINKKEYRDCINSYKPMNWRLRFWGWISEKIFQRNRNTE